MNNIELRARSERCRKEDLCFVSLRALPKELTDENAAKLLTPFQAELGHAVIIYKEYFKS